MAVAPPAQQVQDGRIVKRTAPLGSRAKAGPVGPRGGIRVLSFEGVFSLYFGDSEKWKFPGGRVDDVVLDWTTEIASREELQAIETGLQAFLEGDPDERSCRSFLDANGGQIHKLNTKELSLRRLLDYWLPLVTHQLNSQG